MFHDPDRIQGDASHSAPPRRSPPTELPDYHLLSHIGSGSFGEVWLGRSRKLDTLCAVKLLPEGEKAQIELDGARNFAHHAGEHPHLVRVLHMGEVPGWLYYVLELADGYPVAKGADPTRTYKPRTLREDLRRNGSYDLLDAVALCRDILSGVATLHQAGLVHRDIKPGNIIFVDGVPKLTDVSLIVRPEDVRFGAGTPAYSPPESASDESGDLHCLGATLWELVIGHVEREYPPGLSVAKAEELRRLGPLLERACDPAPAARYHRCEEFARGLDEVVGDDRLGEAGPYRVIRRLDRGEGGMGVVYLAERRDDMKRVALKLVKAGMDTEAVLARFRREREVHLRMHHPAIATAFEAGETSHGRPYFAMEYIVGGVPITEYCDRERLDVRQRLQLFRDVCMGLAHAHGHKVVHRDLKPSNILVRTVDGSPDVKIIDFGVARPLRGGLSEETVTYTVEGELVGTPEYMSPEQAAPVHRAGGDRSGENRAGDAGEESVDVRADVYSLGVLLYELLVGEVPIKGLRSDAPNEIQRRIRDEEPLPAARRWECLNAATRRQRAELRRSSEAAVTRALRGDLNNIISKATAKERNRRYASVEVLAQHLQLYLDDRPVPIAAPGLFYRLRKYIRRHRVPVFAATGVVVALVVVLVGVLIYTARLSEILRLSDMKNLERLESEATALWPPRSDNIPRFEDWLRRARRLAARVDQHRATLEELREDALPIANGTPRMQVHSQVLRSQGGATASEVGSPAGEHRSWQFADENHSWWHDMLQELVADLDRFAQPGGTIEDVEKRLHFARSVRQRTIDEHEPVWQKTIERVAASERYNGLQLRPQEGLIPLGPDPSSGLEEFAHLQTGTLPERDARGTLAMRGDSALVLVLLPASACTIGARKASLGVELEAKDGRWVTPSVPAGSLAASLGMHAGDIVVSVAGETLTSADEPASVVERHSTGETIEIVVERRGRREALRTQMGANVDANADIDEVPVNEVRLEAFFISKYEMTQGQWARVEGTNPSSKDVGRKSGEHLVDDRHPVENISWQMSATVLFKLGLELPTEAQWEYAARGGQSTPWWTGTDPAAVEGTANLADQSAREAGARWGFFEAWDDGYSVHAPVGSYRANAFGLHDVTGNVQEHCRDWWGEQSYELPVAPGDGERKIDVGITKVSRGGSFMYGAKHSRLASRRRYPPSGTSTMIGVRPSRRVEAE